MGILDTCKKHFEVNKVKEWKHLVGEGLTLCTLHLDKSYEEEDRFGKITLVVPTTNHYSELITRTGLTQPKESYIVLKRRLIKLLSEMIIAKYNGVEPKTLTVLIKHSKVKMTHIYDAIEITGKVGLNFVKANILKGNFKILYQDFKTKK